MWTLNGGGKICSTVIFSGDGGPKSEYLGKFVAENGTYSSGRMVYRNGEGKYLKVVNGYTSWYICDDPECSIIGLLSGGGANSMNPADPVAVMGNRRNPNRKSWGFLKQKYKNGEINVKCIVY